jgi:hypothetical protein
VQGTCQSGAPKKIYSRSAVSSPLWKSLLVNESSCMKGKGGRI